MDDLAAWFDAILDFPVGEDALPGERARARLDMALTMAAIPVAASWGLVYLALGQAGAAIFPLVFALGTGGLLEYLWLTRNYYGFQQGNLILGLAVAFGLQWYLGGYIGSGLVLLWGALAVRRALLFGGSHMADAGIIAFAFLALFALLREGPMAPEAYPLTRQEILGHYLVNLVGVAILGHAASRYLADTARLEEVRSNRLMRTVLPGALMTGEGDPRRSGPATVLRLEVAQEALADRGRELEELDQVVARAGLVGLRDAEGGLLAISWDGDAGERLGGLVPMTAAVRVAEQAAGRGARVAMARGEVEGEFAGEESPRYQVQGAPLGRTRDLLGRAEAGRIRATPEVGEALGPRVVATVADDGGGGVWITGRETPGLRPERRRKRRRRRHPRTLRERVWRRRR
jgi:hypothetical protein